MLQRTQLMEWALSILQMKRIVDFLVGVSLEYVYDLSLTNLCQARHPTLHSCVIFLELLQEETHRVAVFHLYPPHHKLVVGC